MKGRILKRGKSKARLRLIDIMYTKEQTIASGSEANDGIHTAVRTGETERKQNVDI